MMKRTMLAVLTVMALGACGDDDNNSAPAADICAHEAKIAKELACPGFTTEEAAVTACRAEEAGEDPAEQALADKCRSQMNQYAACEVAQPASSFECELDGEVSLKEDFCKAQAAAVLACYFTNMGN